MSRAITITESRPLDHVYDPVHAAPGGRELYRAKGAAGAAGKDGGSGNNVFAGKPLQQKSFVSGIDAPAGASKASHAGRTNATGAALDGMVTGPNLFKYYHPPAASRDPNVLPATIKLDTKALEQAHAAATGRARTSALDPDSVLNEDGTMDTGVQTVFRDGEVQTDAFSPDFIVPEGTAPEIARLTFLKFGGQPGHGLPVGLADVEAVEEDRVRAAIQRALPPITDEASFALRKRMMEKLELLAFARKEADLDAENNARLTLISSALEAQANERQFIAEQRVEALRKTLEAETADKIRDVQSRRLKTLRKIAGQRAKEETHVDMLTGTGSFTGVGVNAGRGAKKPTRDIIADYADPSSTVYAPSVRDTGARMPDKLKTSAKFSVNADVAPGLAGSAALDALAKTLPEKLFTVRVGGSGAAAVASVRRAGGTTGTGTGKAAEATGKMGRSSRTDAADAAVGDNLDRIYNMIQTVKAGLSTAAVENEKVPGWRVPKPEVVRPSTPNFDSVDEDEETAQVDAAVALLQTLFRGRAVQNAMLAGTERRLELIREMRADLLTDEEAASLAKEEAFRAQSAARRSAVTATVDTAAGELASAALDFFAKELVRSQEMARIGALAAAADAERKRREEAEKARRWAETHARTLEAAYANAAASIIGAAASAIARTALGDAVADIAHTSAGRATRLVTEVVRPIVEKLEAQGDVLAGKLGLTDRPEENPLPHQRGRAGSPPRSRPSSRAPALGSGLDRLGPDARPALDSMDTMGTLGGMDGEGDGALDLTADSLDLSSDNDEEGGSGGRSPDKAAVRIQAAARGRQARKQVANLKGSGRRDDGGAGDALSPVDTPLSPIAPSREPRDDDGGDAAGAATRIQSVARGRQARKQVAGLRGGASASPAPAPASLSAIPSAHVPGVDAEGAATRIQSIARGRQARKLVSGLRTDGTTGGNEGEAQQLEDAAEVEAQADGAAPETAEPETDATGAATKIQSVARGRQARKQVAGLRGSGAAAEAAPAEAELEPEPAAAEPEADATGAATKIQSVARGRQARKQVASLRGSGAEGAGAPTGGEGEAQAEAEAEGAPAEAEAESSAPADGEAAQ